MDWIRKVPIGQYVAGKKGWLRLVDPRMKMAWLLMFLVSPILASSGWRLGLVVALFLTTLLSNLPIRIWWRSLSFLLIFAFLLGLLAMIFPTSEPAATLTVRDANEIPNTVVIGPPWELIKLGPIRLFNASLGPLVVDRRSLALGIKTSTLIFTVVHSVNLMLITSSPEDLVWALRWFLSPLNLLGLPIDRLSFQLLLSLRFIPLVQEELQNLLRALAVRAVNFRRLGFKASLGLILSLGERLLANILLRSEQGADALIARGGYLIPPQYLKPRPKIARLSFINMVAGLFLFLTLILRLEFGT